MCRYYCVLFSSLIGTVGRGPKYLVDEYAILDTRYWVLDYPAVSSISYIEFFVMLPMCYLWLVPMSSTKGPLISSSSS